MENGRTFVEYQLQFRIASWSEEVIDQKHLLAVAGLDNNLVEGPDGARCAGDFPSLYAGAQVTDVNRIARG